MIEALNSSGSRYVQASETSGGLDGPPNDLGQRDHATLKPKLQAVRQFPLDAIACSSKITSR